MKQCEKNIVTGDPKKSRAWVAHSSQLITNAPTETGWQLLEFFINHVTLTIIESG